MARARLQRKNEDGVMMQIQEIDRLVGRVREAVNSGKTRALVWRVDQLQRLKRLLRENEAVMLEAMAADLGKPTMEAYLTDIGVLVHEIDYLIDHLPGWAKPERVRTQVIQKPARARIYREPLGVVLVLGTWNYPFHLSLMPAAGALAAGNGVVLKPSELAPRCSETMAELVPRYLDGDTLLVVEGAAEQASALLEQRFDHIFFTGSGRVGRIVMTAAAKHLTPVTLELGGKSPCIVDQDIDLEVTARRIVWGKFLNAGQTCVAPDYVLVHRSRKDQLALALKKTISAFYGAEPRTSKDFGRIVSQSHLRRLVALLDEQSILLGGEYDVDERYLAPTLVDEPAWGSPLMEEEIFGPILPILAIDDLEQAIGLVNRRPKPLALYVFSRDKQAIATVLARTSSGGVCVNDTVAHLSVADLPFGGVGESGMGAYHGRSSFETFCHRKSVLDRSTIVDPKVRYPPYNEGKLKIAKWLV
jgi:aldehyde dehydrogenase (NAD+)